MVLHFVLVLGWKFLSRHWMDMDTFGIRTGYDSKPTEFLCVHYVTTSLLPLYNAVCCGNYDVVVGNVH